MTTQIKGEKEWRRECSGEKIYSTSYINKKGYKKTSHYTMDLRYYNPLNLYKNDHVCVLYLLYHVN